jgi:hypothetical protein
MTFGGDGGAVFVFCLGRGGEGGFSGAGFAMGCSAIICSLSFVFVCVWTGWLTAAFVKGCRRADGAERGILL